MKKAGRQPMPGMAPTVYPTNPPAGAPGCCGPIQDRIELIKQVSRGLRDGHHGIAAMYDSIAKDVEDAEEKKQFTAKAIEHRKMGDDSLNILLPDGTEEGAG